MVTTNLLVGGPLRSGSGALTGTPTYDDLRQSLKPFCSQNGPALGQSGVGNPTLIVGYSVGIRSERRLREEVHLISPIAGLPPRTGRQSSRPLNVLQKQTRALSRERCAASAFRERGATLHRRGPGQCRRIESECRSRLEYRPEASRCHRPHLIRPTVHAAAPASGAEWAAVEVEAGAGPSS